MKRVFTTQVAAPWVWVDHRLIEFPYTLDRIQNSHSIDEYRWCCDNLGIENFDTTDGGNAGVETYYFKSDADRLLFKLAVGEPHGIDAS
jgi:hypothetical protein